MPPVVLYGDGHLVILDKPAGLPVHAGPRGGASVEDWFPQLSRRRDGPWLAHRLDADTAGCLAVALRKRTLVDLQALFAAGQVDKTYWAVVHGRPDGGSGRVESRLAKRSDPQGWRMVPDRQGQVAVTDWRWVGGDAELSWLELRPRTGRTHQIRVHCASLGCPILGDAIYGAPPGPPLHLLARGLRLPLAVPVEVVAPTPAHMAEALRQCGLTAPDGSRGTP